MKRLTFKYTFSDRLVFGLFLAGIAILQLPNALTLVGTLTDAESLMALGRVGENKQTYLNMVCVVLAVGLSLAVLWGEGRWSLPRRIGLCLLLWGVLATFSVNFRQARFYQERQHGTLRTLAIASERLIVRELGVLRSLDDFAQEIKDLRPESFEILRDRIRARKIGDDPALGGLPKDARDVAHYMVAVSRLWAFGNEKESSKVGCVLQNEATAFQSVAFAGLGNYLDGPIGCCTDYAYTLKRLLELEGLENRLVETPGHVFNEVLVGGKWWVVDPTLNLMIPHSWSVLMSESPPYAVEVYLLPHWNLAAMSSYVRPKVGSFRHYWLSLIALGRNPEFKYSEVVPPGSFGSL